MTRTARTRDVHLPHTGAGAGRASLWLGIALLAQSPVRAQQSAEVIVWVPSCTVSAQSAPAVLAQLRVELAPATVQAAAQPAALATDPPTSAPTSASTLWLQLCEQGPPQIGVVNAGGDASARPIELSDVPSSMHDRTLALALAELYRSHSAAPPTAPRTPATVVTPTRSPPAGAGARSRDQRGLGWYGALAVRNHSRLGSWFLGPELGVQLGSLRGALLVLGHQSHDALGTLALGSAVLALSYEVARVGHAPALGLRVRGEIGSVLGWGAPLERRSGDEQLALQASALLELPVSLPLGASFRGELALAAGFGRGLIALAEDREVAATHGPFFGATLLIAFAP